MSYHQQIYDRLRHDGLSEAGAIGMLGNWQAESNCEPNRVQGDFSPYRTASKQYVNDVTSGRISRDRFGHDGKGFGLYQLTYFSRKLGYYDFWKQSGKPLDDAGLQCDYAIKELKTDYPGLYNFLCATDDVYSATSRICCEFERPYHNNVQARYEAALRIRKELDLSGQSEVKPSQSEVNQSQSEVNEEPKLETWPPRTIDEHCTGWPEVWLLQSLLKCRGYNVLVDGIWGSLLTDKVKQFQQEHQLDADGAVGPMSWAKLFDRR
jgi:peptidoglycan hydrolase-like protein with peptidoglycan-binding domain